MHSYLRFARANARWLFGGFLLTMFSSFGQTFFISLSTGSIRASFGLSSGEYGAIYMVATLTSALTLTILGRIVDHFAIVKTAAFSMVLLALSALLLSQANSLILLVLALYGLRLFGQGMMSHIAITAMGRWYANNRGKAVSMVSIGFNAGLAVFPIAYIAIVGVTGWRTAWIIGAVLILVVALPSILVLFRTSRVAGEISNSEAESGDTVKHWTLKQMLGDPVFWMTITFLLGPPFISTAIFFHQDFLFAERGWSITIFAWSFIMMTGISIFSGLVSGIVADKTSAAFLLPMFLLPLGTGCFVLAGYHGSLALVAYMALLGISMGVNATIYGSIWPEIYGTKNLGAIRSLVTAMMVFSSAVGPGVMGWAIDLQIALSTQFAAMGLFCVVGTIVLLVCSYYYKRRHLTV